MAGFVVSNLNFFVSSSAVTPVFFVDNTLGTKTVRIKRLIIVGTHNPLDGHLVTVRGNRTLGTLARHSELTARGRYTDSSDQPNMYGCRFYEWDGTSSGMGGFSDGNLLFQSHVVSAPANHGSGFILKAGDNLAVQVAGHSAGTTLAHLRCFGTVDQ